MPAGVIWDMDGTLCDTLPLCLHAFREVIRQYTGETVSDERIVATFGVTEAGVLRHFIPDRWREAEESYLEVYRRDHDRLGKLFPGVMDMLNAVQAAGIRQGIVTGKGLRSAHISIHRLGLTPFMAQVRGGSDDQPNKPQAIASVVQAWQVDASNVCYVGDTAYDVVAAREAGVQPVRVRWAGDLGGMDRPGAVPVAEFTEPVRLTEWLLGAAA